MKKKLFKSLILIVLFTLIIFQNRSEACHLSQLTIISGPVDLGGGNYQYTIKICTGTGGAAMGFICEEASVGDTQNYNISTSGTSIISTGNTTITSGFNGIVSTASIAGGILYYNAPSPIYQSPSTTDACDVYGPITQWCWNVTFTTSGLASNIQVDGLEGIDTGQGASGCSLAVMPVEIEEHSFDQDDLIIFPNPSNGIISFSLKENTFTKPGTIKVFNFLGLPVYTGEYNCSIKNEVKTIDLGNFSKGTYFLEAQINNNPVYKKIILN